MFIVSFVLLLLYSLSEDDWVIFQFLYYDVCIGCGDDVFSKSVNIKRHSLSDDFYIQYDIKVKKDLNWYIYIYRLKIGWN